MSQEIELRECPFCGTLDSLINTYDDNCYKVRCGCGCEIHGFDYRDSIKKWNTRYQPNSSLTTEER